MSLRSFIRNNFKVIVTIVVTILAILGRKYLSYFSVFQEEASVTQSFPLFSQDQLKNYNGIIKNKLHLAVTGLIFDVTKNADYYREGASYHYFVGKDGSRALVTGNFKDESEDKDHILNLKCKELFILLDWRKTFTQRYPNVGLLVGRYYDKYGRETEYTRMLKEKVKSCIQDKEREEKEMALNPPCNTYWGKDEGIRVWCTVSSGGIIRNWVGVPRQHYNPGDTLPKCVCVQLHKANAPHLKPYSGCSETSEECWIKDKDENI